MRRTTKKSLGFTLIELSVSIGLILILSSSGFIGFQWWSSYREQLISETSLNIVASGQRSYLIDNPTLTYTNITAINILPYLPNGQMPPFPTGTTTNITIFPPTATKGANTWTAKDF
jgi:prepilin-type N-terminal cleavage/methylation domain-containing protein